MSLAKRKRSKYPNFVAVGKDMLYDPEWQKLSPVQIIDLVIHSKMENQDET